MSADMIYGVGGGADPSVPRPTEAAPARAHGRYVDRGVQEAQRAAVEEAAAKGPVESSIEETLKGSDEADLASATEKLNRVMDAFQKGLRFRVHKETDELYVQVVNRQTREVMRTIPPERMMDLMARVHEVLGLILDRVA